MAIYYVPDDNPEAIRPLTVDDIAGALRFMAIFAFLFGFVIGVLVYSQFYCN